MSSLTFTDASFSYNRRHPETNPVFSHLSFDLREGEIMAILGPNGAGKTTCLRCLLGFLKLTDGSCTIDGKDIRDYSGRELFSHISYVPQGRSFISSFTVLENVLFGLTGEKKLFDAPNEKDIEKAAGILSSLGIRHLMEKNCRELSGGELQMVLIARALISDPKILILDEPESGLDFKNQLIVLQAIRSLSEKGMICLFNTHYPEHALSYADKALLIYEGQGIYGKTDEVITVENIRKSFHVDSVISSANVDGREVKTVIPLRKSED